MTCQTSLTLLDRLTDASDAAAWSLFVDIYRPLMYHAIHNLGIERDEADDLVQDCLSRLVRALPEFEHNGRTGAFRNWLRKIVVNRTIEFLEQRQRGTRVLQNYADVVQQYDDSFREYMDREHDRHVIARILELIRGEFTRTVWLAFERQVIDGQPAASVAQEMACSVNAVLLSKSRVLRRMRELGRGLVEC